MGEYECIRCKTITKHPFLCAKCFDEKWCLKCGQNKKDEYSMYRSTTWCKSCSDAEVAYIIEQNRIEALKLSKQWELNHGKSIFNHS